VAKQFIGITDAHRGFIRAQHIFFVASSAPGSHVNVSPRSTECFRILNDKAVAYLDRTGSGNETAAHILAGGPMTIMFCAFDAAPNILRLYGRGAVHHCQSEQYTRLLEQAFDGTAPLGTRQIIVLNVELVKSSCGYGVPLFTYHDERTAMDTWAKAKGEAGIKSFQQKHNIHSMDGLPTGLSVEDRND
jgi:hypothetical protein